MYETIPIVIRPLNGRWRSFVIRISKSIADLNGITAFQEINPKQFAALVRSSIQEGAATR